MTLSYTFVCMLLNFLIGFLAIMLFVQSPTRDENPYKHPYNIVIGSTIYLAIVIFFCVTTTGWTSLLAAVAGSCGIFWVGQPRDVCRMWGRVFGKIADFPRVRRIGFLHEALLTVSDALRMIY